MALGLVETLAALELEIDHFLVAVLVEHGGSDGRAFEDGVANAVFTVGTVEEDLIERDGATDFGIEFFDVKFDALGNAVLFAAGFDDCESHMPEPGGVKNACRTANKAGREGREIPTPPRRAQVVFTVSAGLGIKGENFPPRPVSTSAGGANHRRPARGH